MPRQKGLVKIEGTLDDITFFKRKDVFLVRTKGGVSKERIMNDPTFLRTRENGTEFGSVAGSGKILRNACSVLTKSAYDGSLSNRLVQELTKVKNADITSARGERQVYVGIATVDGKLALKGFNLNSRAPLSSILFAPFTLDTASGKVSIVDLNPLDMLKYPPNATHVSFQSAFLNLNFDGGVFEITYSPIINLVLDSRVGTLTLSPTAVPAGTGTAFYLLLIEFFQEVNGVQYALNNGNYNTLSLLDVV